MHVFVSGGTWEWYRPLRPGDRIFSFRGEESLDTKLSEFAGRSVIQVSRDVAVNQFGEVLGVYRILRVLTERSKSREKGKYAEIAAATYTDEDYERIDAVYAQEGPRGAEKRYWEDVAIGDELPPMVKGPTTITEMIAFHAGGYGFVPYGLRASRVGYKNRKRIAPFYVKNAQGIYDVAQRLHWDSEWAKAIGNPMAYDYGVQRQCWFYHHVADWAGDDACITHLVDSIRKFNYMGDVQFLSGNVVGKRDEDGQKVVDLELRMINQRDTETAYGTATVALPSRDSGLPVFPRFRSISNARRPRCSPATPSCRRSSAGVAEPPVSPRPTGADAALAGCRRRRARPRVRSSTRGSERARQLSAVTSSNRARWEPRHRWKPLANPMCGFGLRSKSTVSGSGKVAASRFAEDHETRTLAPAGNTVPLGNVISSVVSRIPSVTGDSNRISSSTALPISEGSATTRARCSGCRAK